MKICKRCGRQFDRKGYFCVTCYRHHRIEQRPELAPKLQGRYSVSVKRVSPDMDEDKVVYNRSVVENIYTTSKRPSPWQGSLRMGKRLSKAQVDKNRLMMAIVEPLPMPRVK